MASDYDYSWDDQDPDQIQESLEFSDPDEYDVEEEESQDVCECGIDCELNYDGSCGCEKCPYCDDCSASCGCEVCEDCKELIVNCECEVCESCHESTFHCDCLKCFRCKKLPIDCSCSECDCPVCRLSNSLHETSIHPDKESLHQAVFTRVGALWSREEDQYIAAEYLARKALPGIAVQTGRTETAVLSRLNAICFPKPEKDIETYIDYVPRPWTPLESEALVRHYETGLDLSPIATRMQRPLWELRNHLIQTYVAKPVGLEDMKYGEDKSAISSSRRWTPEDLTLLTELFAASTSIEDIAETLERSVGAVISKLLRRHLLDEVDIDLAIKQASTRYHRVNKTGNSGDAPF